MNNSDDDLHELVAQTLRTSFRFWSWLNSAVLMARFLRFLEDGVSSRVHRLKRSRGEEGLLLLRCRRQLPSFWPTVVRANE